MSSSTLIAHCGSSVVTREEVLAVAVPEPTRTWFPVGHGQVVEMIEQALCAEGFTIKREQFALLRAGQARMFATFDLESALDAGVTLSVGVRNSIDKSLPLGFCAGNRVFVCDNLSFRSELMVNRKHTRNGLERYREAIALASKGLVAFQKAEEEQVRVLQVTPVSDTLADSVILRAFEDGIVSSRALPDVIKEWRTPTYEDFQARNFWSLFNSFTTILGPHFAGNPQRYAGVTMSLRSLVGRAAGLPSEAPQEMAV